LSTDEEQNRRLENVESDVYVLKEKVTELDKAQALVVQSIDNLSENITTGMFDLKETQALRDKAQIETRKAEREDNKWWWGKVFAIVTAVVTLAGTGGGVAYSQMGRIDTVEVAPTPAPASVPVPTPPSE